MRSYDVATSFAASVVRAGAGMAVGNLGRRPDKPLELYEFEACPYCRKVREAASVLDLEVMIYPCPKGGQRFRPVAAARSGKAQFPFLVDTDNGRQMLESDDIVRYLFETYGDGSVPWALCLPIVTDVSSAVASLVRFGAGRSLARAESPALPLELWSFEASPYCRLVRERLCELELPYLLHNVAKGRSRRDAFVRRSGRMMVPYLADPNTGAEMFESADICAYLDGSYGLG